MAKILGLKQIQQKTYKLLEGLSQQWAESLGNLEEVFMMIVWGDSGHGKSNFLMQFIREISKYGTVLYLALEEGHTLTTQTKVVQHLSGDGVGRIQFADHEMSYEKLVAQLKKKKQARYIVIDSLQYWHINYEDYKRLKETFPKKSFIFISHAKGKNPSSSTAVNIRYDAGLKVRVEGKVAFIESRYGGNKNYVIWEQGAKNYWGKKFNKIKNR